LTFRCNVIDKKQIKFKYIFGIKMIDYTNASKTYDNTRNSDEVNIDIMSKKGVFECGKNILDFGCGTGNYLQKISEKYQCKCYGLEPSVGMREKAHKKLPNLLIVEGNHDNILFENNFFDYIYMTIKLSLERDSISLI
jgi:ubiquinone/menaquinone biosynthesis C-methylase UbiE